MTIYGNWLQNVTYAARIDRQILEGLTNGEGVVGLAAFKGTLNTGTLSIDIAAGQAIVQGDDQTNQGRYAVLSDASANVALTAPASDSKYVAVGLQVQDPNATGPAGDNVILDTVDGSSGSSPTKPTIPDSFLLLYWVLVPSTATVGSDCTAEDMRSDVQSTPTGSIMPWAGSNSANLPAGYLRADGSAVSRTTYASLWEVCGTTYGSGDGSTTFNLPDLRGRVPVGIDDMGNGDAGRLTIGQTLGSGGGQEEVALTVVEMPAHDHSGDTGNTTATHNHGSGSYGADSGGSHTHNQGTLATTSNGSHFHEMADTFARLSGAPVGRSPSESAAADTSSPLLTASAGAHTHTITGSVSTHTGHTHTVSGTSANGGASHKHTISSQGSGAAHTNMQPYVALSYLIKT